MTLPWHKSLTASVHALGAAANEARLAARAARTTLDLYSLDRLNPAEGRVTQPGVVYNTMSFHPHTKALYRIAGLHRTTADLLHSLYVTTTRAYADGAIWAIGQVLDGKEPEAVHGLRTDNGQFAVVGPLPFIDAGLNRWPGWPELNAARAAMLSCQAASDMAEDIAAADHVTEREAGEMFDAGRHAEGLPDAAYTFGTHAEQALRHVLRAARHAA
ncbi:hypothetical protein ACFWXO_40295 [Kitasatospora sp. NPDC059088]|uniref:hypothetical protein n=1 Tax=Kitasatospora sp. NPDC059088 TaxID=3346722 RepID=UPI003686D893